MDGNQSQEILMEGDDDLLNYFMVAGGDNEPLSPFDVDEVNSGMENLMHELDGQNFLDSGLSTSDQRDLFPLSTESNDLFNSVSDFDSNEPFDIKHGILDDSVLDISPGGPQYANQVKSEPLVGSAPTPLTIPRPARTTPSTTKPKPRTTKPRPKSAKAKTKTNSVNVPAVKVELASGGMNPMKLSPGGDSALETEEKRQRRLARNRESARQSRRRKKQYLELLEEKVSTLTKEIDGLRRNSLEISGKAIDERKLKIIDQLSSLLGRDGVQNDILQGLASLQQHCGPNSRERKVVMDYHFKQLFNLVMPPYTKFLLWMMNQGDEFFDTKAGQKGKSKGSMGLWPLVSTELGLSVEQQEKLKQNYKGQDTNAAQEECAKLNRCLKCLDTLRKGIEARSTAVQAQSDAISKILTPEQMVRYLKWMETNRERIRRCGLDEETALLSLGTETQPTVMEEKFNVAQKLLNKPDVDLQLGDLEKLMSIVEG